MCVCAVADKKKIKNFKVSSVRARARDEIGFRAISRTPTTNDGDSGRLVNSREHAYNFFNTDGPLPPP